MNYEFRKVTYDEAITISKELLAEYGHTFTIEYWLTKYVDLDKLSAKLLANKDILSYNNECKGIKIKKFTK